MLNLRMAAPLLMAVFVSINIFTQALSTSQHALVFGASSATLPAVTRSSARKLSASRAVVDVPLYLIPTRQPSLCTDGNCCHSDYHASTYSLHYLNSTQTTIAQQQLTTFYWTLRNNQQQCSGDCCTANISKIWIDVDPKVKVQYMSFNNDTSNFATQQDQYGFHIIPYNGLLTAIPSEGAVLTVTVTGNVSQLCPVPDYMLGVPVNGTCQVVLLGSTPDGSSTCCPHGLTKPRTRFTNYRPSPLMCIQSLDSSPFDLSLSSVGLPYPSGSRLIANYSFTLSADAANCNTADINTCCGMGLDSLTFSLAPGVTVLSTQLEGKDASVDASTARKLTLQHLGLTSASLPRAGVSIVLTVQLPTGSSSVPDICQATPSTDGSVGRCAFTFTSATGSSMCCPTSTTNALFPGTATPSPTPTPTPAPTPSPTPTPTPSPSPGTCQPTTSVPLKDTSMGFNYYNGPLPTSPASTSFQFTVYNNAQCNKPYCQDVCSWTLLLNPQFARLLTFSTDSPADNGSPLMDPSGISVTFTSPPPHAGTLLYTVVVAQAGVTLEQLCSATATPGQASACTAIIRNPSVLSTVQFGQRDILVPGSSPPSSPTPSPGPAAACTNGKDLSSSCLRVDAATYNSPAGSASTVLDFNVVNHDGEKGCTPDDAVMTFKVLLAGGVAAELGSSKAIVPSTAQFASDGSSITWTWSPVQAGQSLHYQLDVAASTSVASICAQGVLPAQPAGSCAVVFTGATSCYMGFVTVAYDPNLQPLPVVQPTSSSSSSSSDLASIVAPAVIVPLAVLAAVLAALYFMVYRRRRAAAAGGAARAAPDQADELAAPLHEPSASNISRSSASVASERSGSDVQIRLPSESAALL